jgi:hypothetical protein
MAEPHTDTGHDDGTALAVALIGLFLVAALLVVPWFVGDGWDGAWRQTPQGQPFVVVQGAPVPKSVGRPKARSPTADEGEIDSSDPPPYAFAPGAQMLQNAPDTPDLSKLCVVTS